MRLQLIVAAALVASCGGDADPDAAIGIRLDEAPAAYASAYCARVFACCDATDLATRFPGADPPVTDVATCESYVARVFGNEFVADARHAETMGWARYDGAAFASCMDHLRADACGHLARVFALMVFPAECAPARVPLVSAGGQCDHDFQCIAGVCVGGSETQIGQCATAPAIGTACVGGECGPEAYCDRSVDPDGTCAALAPDGAACTSALACASFTCVGASPGVPGACAAPTVCDGV